MYLIIDFRKYNYLHTYTTTYVQITCTPLAKREKRSITTTISIIEERNGDAIKR